ncbi:type I-E CRISPR-associated protein Cse1/CasA [Arthrobacter sp.]|uniref:type I-E CRISPR-associated protein Cse1/CasA n=1 Tax=Arthrobacter sp. TaxID=1667 RepID=UPI0034E883DB
MTVRDALINAHDVEGLDPLLNGIQTGALLRFLTAVASLVLRGQGNAAGAFDAAAVDAALSGLYAHSDLFDRDRPFLQVPAGAEPPEKGVRNPVKKLLPWMPADRAEDFWSENLQATELDMAGAALALAVHHHYSFGGNNRLDGRACVNGSPGIRYPGVGYTATEVLWHGRNLFETLLMNTPKVWVDGTGLPAWADPDCVLSQQGAGRPEHPLWRATWGSNTAKCRWEGDRLTAVSTGGSPYRPPTMGAGKLAAKAWWDLRNTEDDFYLYVDVETKVGGIVTGSARKAQRLDLGHNETDLAVEWNAKNLSTAMRRRSRGTVKPPARSARVMFLRHLVEGSASSPVVRRTEVLISSPKKWMVDVDRADAVSDASLLMQAVCAELCKPFTPNGRLSALQDRRVDVESSFWQLVSKPFEDFIINGTGDFIDPSVWAVVRASSLAAFDQVTESAPMAKLAPFIMAARSGVSQNTSKVLKAALSGASRAYQSIGGG